MAKLTVLPDQAAMRMAAAERIASLIEGATTARGAALLALAGGNTPEPVYQLLSDAARPWRATIDWARVHLYWTDERNVPPSHADSNFGMANRTLIQRVPIPASQIHRMRGERPAVEAAREYSTLLRTRRSGATGALFDVTLLGIGADAHVASIFPGSPVLELQKNLAAGVWVPALNQSRITLTPPALLDSDAILVLATGSPKAAAVAAATAGEFDAANYPAQLLRGAGDRVEWILDAAAARLVSP